MSEQSTNGTEQCPACETEVTNPNPESDYWYCESGECEVVIFGPRGLNREVEPATAQEGDDA